MTSRSVFLMGISRRSGAASRPPAVPALLDRLRAIDGVHEAALLSTCSRTEVYFVAEDLASVGPRVQMFVFGGDEGHAEAAPNCLRDQAAVRHLLRVASGVDSAIVGDGQILGQVRQAYTVAREAGATGPLLNRLFETALRAGKRARRETALGSGATTAASAAVDMVARTAGPLDRRQVLVIGAGDTAKLAACHLSRLHPARLVVANRTCAHAEAIASRVEGTAIGLDALPAALAAADVVVSATGSPTAVISIALVREVMARRQGRPLLFVDLAVPGDIDRQAATVPGVTLVDLDRVQADTSRNQAARTAAVPQVEAIVADEARAFDAWRRAAGVADVIRALRAHAETARLRMLGRESRPGLDPVARERQLRLQMNRRLHRAVVLVKGLAGTVDGEARLSRWRTHQKVPGTVKASMRP